MKIAVKFDHYFVAPAEKIPAILEALANGELYEASGWGFDKDTKLTKCNSKPAVYFVEDDQFEATPEPIKELQERLKQSDSRWISYYNEATKLAKEKKELEDKLAAIQSTVEGA